MDISVIEKPDSITFDEIHEVLWKANEENRKKGFLLKTSVLDADKLKDRLGDKGKCFIAVDNGRVVGTISVRIVKRNKWYFKGELPDYMLAAVLPEYQGKHINSLLAQKVFEYAIENGYEAVELDTAEENTHAIDVYKHQGFKLVDFLSKTGVDHYSVVMIKWFDRNPCSDHYRVLRYLIKRAYIKFRYKENKKKRFGI